MRKRQLKKFAKNAKRNREPYRRAHSAGSKKDRRRQRAFRRLDRSIERDRLRKMGIYVTTLEELSTIAPRNAQEAAAIAEAKTILQKRLAKHAAAIEFNSNLRELAGSMRQLTREFAMLSKSMEGYNAAIQSVG